MHNALPIAEVLPLGSLPYGADGSASHSIGFVPSMNSVYSYRPRVLCFSQDRVLGTTRRAILQRQYDAVFVDNLQDLAALTTGVPFDVIVLCHTLSLDERIACFEVAQSAWPSARFVSITTRSRGGQPVKGAEVGGLEGPQALLSCVQQTLESTLPGSGPS